MKKVGFACYGVRLVISGVFAAVLAQAVVAPSAVVAEPTSATSNYTTTGTNHRTIEPSYEGGKRRDRFDAMVSPAFDMTNFEDPRIDTEIRPMYIYHKIDNDFLSGGGNVQVYALQGRIKLADDLALILTKDGMIYWRPKNTLPKDTGMADLGLGIKKTLYQDSTRIFSGQLRYTFPVGDETSSQGQASGEIQPSVSYANALSDEVTMMFGTGMRIGVGSGDSSLWDTDVQVDYRIDTPNRGSFHPLVGVSMNHVMTDGHRVGGKDEGMDFFNFGANDAAGETIISGATGVRYRACNQKLELGATYQFPLDKSSGTQFLDWRWTFDAIYKF